MQIRESAEDYLEAILRLSQKGGGVRSVDIATMLSVSKPSVSHAMKLLREDGYIAMDRYGTVTPVSYTHLDVYKRQPKNTQSQFLDLASSIRRERSIETP